MIYLVIILTFVTGIGTGVLISDFNYSISHVLGGDMILNEEDGTCRFSITQDLFKAKDKIICFKIKH